MTDIRRRPIQGLYSHASMPKVLPMNGIISEAESKRDRQLQEFNVKSSVLRIWIHEKDIKRLSGILWNGQGKRLLQQTSHHPKVRRFLAAVPHIMNRIRELHDAVIENNLELMIWKLEPPAPHILVTSRDVNGLTLLHKAAGLGHASILEYLIKAWPEGVNKADITGKMPAHYAAAARNNSRCYTLLVEAGCDEEAVDLCNRTPSYFRSKPNSLERSYVTFRTKAPRVPEGVPIDWEALGYETPTGDTKLDKNGDTGTKPFTELLYEGANVTPSTANVNASRAKKVPVMVPVTEGNGTNENNFEVPKDFIIKAERTEKPLENIKVAESESAGNQSENGKDMDELQASTKVVMNHEEVPDKGATSPTGITIGTATIAPATSTQKTADTPPIYDTIKYNLKYIPNNNGNGNDNHNHTWIKDSVMDSGNQNDYEIQSHSDNETTNYYDNNDDHNHNNDNHNNDNDNNDNHNNDNDNNDDYNNDNDNNDDHNHNNDNHNDNNDDHNNDNHNNDDYNNDNDDHNDNNYDNNNDNNDNDDNNDDVNNDNDNGKINGVTIIKDHGIFEDTSADDNEISQYRNLMSGISDGRDNNHHNLHNSNEIENIITSGDMAQLAEIVLNGDGEYLLNRTAVQPEVQAFINNVPNYMNKIRNVHGAARSGSLLSLQQALDRRKFAIARTQESPNGATPLHVAVLFGSSDILRYLAARFPETSAATDFDGRTPLHYAAVINDNGHFYNLLLQLGANPQATDKLGYTPEQYLNDENLRRDIFNYRQLLQAFHADELENILLKDQGQIVNQSYQDNAIFRTEQGKYLADNLASPLIKGLTRINNERPKDPVQYLANYLQNYLSIRDDKINSKQNNNDHDTNIMENVETISKENNNENFDLNEFIEETKIHENLNDLNDVNADNDDNEAAIMKRMEERDEHGQSMLHFACARSNRKGALINLIEESGIDITYRDELYRTARDISFQANQLSNAKEIDRYVLSMAAFGDVKPFEHLALSGYDHIIDINDDNDVSIIELAEQRDNTELVHFLRGLRSKEELREELHQMIRDNNLQRALEIAQSPNGKWLIKAKNYYGRTALHIAILKESVELVENLMGLCPEAIRIGDNLERSPLHYAMGTDNIENLSRILIQNGAKRTVKDLKGRQPSYYFMNKADILRLQEEENENR